MESKTNKSVLLSVLALAVMVGSGLLVGWTVNTLRFTLDPGLIFILVLVSVFLYVTGASLMGRVVVQTGGHWKYGGFHNGILFALLAVGIGCLLLCLNSGVLPMAWKYFFISWPMLLFVLGCCELCKIHHVPGIILLSVGTFFLVPRFSGIFPGASFDGQFFATWWPIFIIIGGLLIFFSILLKPKKFFHAHHRHAKGCWDENHFTTQEENRDGKINYKLILSGTEQVILDPVFKGGTIETVLGGLELDLRRTALPEGDTFLFIKAVLGGVDIQMPEEWNIEVRSDSILGGVSDDRIKVREIDYTRKLIIVANAVFGGVTIR